MRQKKAKLCRNKINTGMSISIIWKYNMGDKVFSNPANPWDGNSWSGFQECPVMGEDLEAPINLLPAPSQRKKDLELLFPRSGNSCGISKGSLRVSRLFSSFWKCGVEVLESEMGIISLFQVDIGLPKVSAIPNHVSKLKI